MAHFARVIDGVVTDVIVVDNKDCGGGDFPESEAAGQAFLAEQGLDGTWLQTSYTGTFRRRLAVSNGFYDETADVFYPVSPGSNWTMNTDTWNWESPSGSKLPND